MIRYFLRNSYKEIEFRTNHPKVTKIFTNYLLIRKMAINNKLIHTLIVHYKNNTDYM